MTRLETQLVHGAAASEPHGAVNPPIYDSSTFAFETVGSMPRYDYSRSGNPTRAALETQLAALEAGDRGFAFASGLAAIHATLSIFRPGDRIVVGDNIYGGTYSLLHEYFEERGILTQAVDTTDPLALRAALAGVGSGGKPAAAVYFETLTNPLLRVNDVAQIAALAHEAGALAIVDNTFVTPYLQQPLTLGADIVIHSATKYLGGHSDVVAGAVVTRTPELSERIYFAQNRLGGVLAPAECDKVRRGIQTLGIRMERQQENAVAIAQYLAAHPLVAHVNYPGLPGSAGGARLAAKGLRGFGAVLSFEVERGIDPADVLDNLKLFTLAVSLGAVESLAELPAVMTHFELPREERLKAGISDELVRLSIGIENVDDLIDDLEQAFEIARQRASLRSGRAFGSATASASVPASAKEAVHVAA